MLLQLSKNSFVRQFGDFTYIMSRISLYDEMFSGAEVFMRWIMREPMEKAEILKNICGVYSEADPKEITADFDEFLAPLLERKVILSGRTPAEIAAKEESFSYDVDDPKTLKDTKVISREEADFLPQNVLGKYFQEHPTIFRLQMDITQACTERCVHCYIPEYNPVYLPFGKIREILDEFREMGGLELTLSGGECMMHPDFDRIVRYAREKDLIVGVLSNLTLCDDRKIRLLQETEATVQVSLYSMDPETHDAITRRKGSWEKTKSAIEKLREAQIPCRISCPTMKSNFRGYMDVLNYARSLKMSAQTDFIIMGKMDGDCSNLSCRLDLAETEELLKDIIFKSVPMNSEYFNPSKKDEMLSDEEWMANKVCGAVIDSVCIDAEGNYYPCPAFGSYILGSCYKQSLTEVWLKSPATLKLRNVRGRDFPKCVKCKDRNYCSVCMCRNINETGDIFTPAEHFCKVAEINHKLVDRQQEARMKK
ncbi:MAG: radical SAM protein [Lentisphaeria bacterium]|nr:radical SAM protein [Lentisphaeria bacterium]